MNSQCDNKRLANNYLMAPVIIAIMLSFCKFCINNTYRALKQNIKKKSWLLIASLNFIIIINIIESCFFFFLLIIIIIFLFIVIIVKLYYLFNLNYYITLQLIYSVTAPFGVNVMLFIYDKDKNVYKIKIKYWWTGTEPMVGA